MRYAHNPHLQRRNHRKVAAPQTIMLMAAPAWDCASSGIASMIAISSSRKPFSVPETDRSANLPPR